MNYIRRVILGMFFVSFGLLQCSAAALNKRCGRESSPLRIDINACFESLGCKGQQSLIAYGFDKEAKKEAVLENEKRRQKEELMFQETWERGDLEEFEGWEIDKLKEDKKFSFYKLTGPLSLKKENRDIKMNVRADLGIPEITITPPVSELGFDMFVQCCVCGVQTSFIATGKEDLKICSDCKSLVVSKEQREQKVCVFCRTLGNSTETGSCRSCQQCFNSAISDLFKTSKKTQFTKHQKEAIAKKAQETSVHLLIAMQSKMSKKDAIWSSLEESLKLTNSCKRLETLKIYAGCKEIEGARYHVWLTELPAQGYFYEKDLNRLPEQLSQMNIENMLTVPTGAEFQGNIPASAICLPVKK